MHQGLIFTLSFSALGGIAPAMIWLWFWLREDKKHPEPKKRIFVSFLSGMIAVPVALIAELKYCDFIGNQCPDGNFVLQAIILLAVLAAIEEIAKFAAGGFSSFGTREYDEPIDSMIYLISAALGFAALENTLFLLNQIGGHWGIVDIFVANNLRFIGATLLHVVSSGFLGGILALAFYRSMAQKILYSLLGLLTAVLLHTAFNFFIIKTSEAPNLVLYVLWSGALALILFFEKIKRLKIENYVKTKKNFS